MAVRIRLTRMGAKHRAFYRIVVADAKMPRDGRFIEQLGSYNPVERPVKIRLKEARTVDWILKGAEVSDTVNSLLKRTKTLEKLHLIKMGKKPKLEDLVEEEFKERKKKGKKEKKVAAQTKTEAEVTDSGQPQEKEQEQTTSEEKK